VALVGASTSDGNRVRKALMERGIPGSRVDLYGQSNGEVLISEYNGEARLVQSGEVEEVAGHDLVLLCERGTLAAKIAAATRGGSVVIDLAGALPESANPRLVHMDVNPEAAREHAGFLAVPHPLAILLGELLHPLERELGIEEAVALIIRPAADFGDEGIEELREQTVRLLNFSEVPVETFGRQLAFNVIPQRRLPCEPPSVETRTARDVTELLGWERNLLALRLFAAPMFYGHGLQLRLRFRDGASVDQVQQALADSPLVEHAGEDAPATPMDASGRKELAISELSDDGLGAVWLWAVAGETDRRLADQAIRLAEAVSDL
jgi:aspartate-semialdehyde dehydrogenase